MEFEWDGTKSEQCLARRGFDFAYAIRAFADPHRVICEDHRWDYGERRYQLLGEIDGRVFFIVYTLRQSGIRIIPACKANRREGKEYENGSRQG